MSQTLQTIMSLPEHLRRAPHSQACQMHMTGNKRQSTAEHRASHAPLQARRMRRMNPRSEEVAMRPIVVHRIEDAILRRIRNALTSAQIEVCTCALRPESIRFEAQ